ncbi:MAG: ECF transporter S component [Candidatus Staskawiczbacteria bacterium]|nr:ECF transporter S component [Candidatus Staskawiczbacteria bacterium]
MEKNQKTLSLNSKFLCLDLGLTEYRTYILSLALVAGSIALPYALHHFYMVGQIILPVYFFVLIGAYKFGWKVGIITAISSVFISFFLTGMPMLTILPFVIIKGVLLSLTASFFARMSGKLSIVTIVLIVFSYQLIGSTIIHLFTHNLTLSMADVVLGYPGLFFEIIGGYILLKFISRYGKKELETN